MSDARPFSMIVAGCYGLAELTAGLANRVSQALVVRPLAWAARNFIRDRYRGYRIRLNHVDTLRPTDLTDAPSVAVIGGGLAGMTAAWALSARGVAVTIFERDHYIGGKLGAWHTEGANGEKLEVEHGFHAFFGAYYNLDRLITKLGVDDQFTTLDDYRILTREGESMSFAGLETTPFMNLVHMVWKGIFSWRGMLLNPKLRNMDPLLRYDPISTPATLDHTSYEEFAAKANLPARMRLMFTSFSRAFFARDDQMSMAEMIKSFHLFYLSNDRGLGYRYANDFYGRSFLGPFRARLEAQGVRFVQEKAIEDISRQKNGRLRVANRPFDHVVLSTDVRGAYKILDGSELAQEAPDLVGRLAAIQPQNTYAVLRLWIDKDIRRDLPVFTFTEKRQALDSVTACHRAQTGMRDWVIQRGGGAVLELHAYQVAPNIQGRDAIRAALIADMDAYFPELRGYKILHEDLQVRDDFTPYFVGMHASRPPTDVGIEGLSLAGDWVRLPCPAMLMEAAVTSGLLAANRVLDAHGVREEPVYTVPLRSMLAFDA